MRAKRKARLGAWLASVGILIFFSMIPMAIKEFFYFYSGGMAIGFVCLFVGLNILLGGDRQ